MQLSFACMRLATKRDEGPNGVGEVAAAQKAVLQFHAPKLSHVGKT